MVVVIRRNRVIRELRILLVMLRNRVIRELRITLVRVLLCRRVILGRKGNNKMQKLHTSC
jgi:hypothetical protein